MKLVATPLEVASKMSLTMSVQVVGVSTSYSSYVGKVKLWGSLTAVHIV